MAGNTTVKDQLARIEHLEGAINRLGELLERVSKLQETAMQRAAQAPVRPSYNRPQRVVKSEAEIEKTHGPWRIDPTEFREYAEQTETTKHNLSVAKLLAVNLDRGTGVGPAEGQLYIEWRKQVGKDEADAWWMNFNGKPAPDGL
jgi:hypothetical protein